MGFSDASERGAGAAPNRDRTGDLRPRLAHKQSTNGHPLASVPESRVTVADPSTVLMARRKFPGTAVRRLRSARGWRRVSEQT